MQNQHELRLLEKCEKLENELVLKNRELEIEAALERIRSRSMAMHKSDELMEVIQLVYEQLVRLGLKIDSTNFCLNYKESDDFAFWTAIAGSPYPTEFYIPYFDHPWFVRFKEAKTKGLQFTADRYSFEEKNTFYSHFFEHAPAVTEERKKYILSCPGLTMSMVYMNTISLLITNYEGIPFTDKENEVFMRIGNVFEQTYTRFLDLQKAEAQAREADIEASLERVRAKAMAMHSSKDIESATAIVFNELSRLGIDMERCGLTLMNKAPIAEIWSTPLSHENREVVNVITGYVDLGIHPILQQCYQDWREKKDLCAYKLVGEEVRKYYAKLEEQPEYKFPKVANYPNQQILNTFYLKEGVIFAYTIDELSVEAKDIIQKFTKVFAQTYTRFLDIQKAEAQAREAQIEAALEKVRSSSLAMHSSDQIREIVKVVFEKLKELQFAIDGGVFVGTMSNNSDHINYWIGDDHAEYPNSFKFPYYDAPTIRDVWDAKKSGVEFVSKTYSFQEKNIWFEYAFYHTDLKNVLPEDFKKWILQQEYLTQSFAMQKNSMIGVHFHHAKTIAENEIDIMKRFSRVFEQGYVRFLDLQKAEAQVRESEIQLALERVRARTMAMHNSSELSEAATLLFQQVFTLGFDPIACAFIIMNEKDKTGQVFISADGSIIPQSFQHPYSGDPAQEKIFQAWQNGDANAIIDLEGKPLKSHLEFIAKAMPVHAMLKSSGQPQPRRLVIQTFNFQHGFLGVNFLTPQEEVIPIMERFAKVFEQTYTRFLDLQRAEAQARESEIQLALERVRARTMAMHRSDELVETASRIFQQLELLGIKLWTFGFNVWVSDQPLTEAWSSSASADIMWKMKVPHDVDPSLIEIYEHRNQNIPLYYKKLKGEQLKKHIEYMFVLIGETAHEIAKSDVQIPSEFHFYAAYFKDGYLLFVLDHEIPEASRLFPRFAMVFEQTHTRFLDLQKAEAQTREAQIEAALERVRSRTMAMHKTDELQEVVRVVAEELKNTGVILDTWGAVICTYFQDSNDVLHWTAAEDPANPSIAFLLPYFRDELYDEAWTSKNRGDNYFAKVFSFEVKNAFFKHAFEHSDYRYLPDDYKKTILERESHGIAWAWANKSAIMIPSVQGDLPSAEEKEILIRFAKVFEQAYVRFLDLQKAEAQAQEAIKRASVDRVRAEIASMRTKGDLERIQPLIWNELKILRVPFIRCGVFIMDELKQDVQVFLSTPDGKSIAAFRLPYYATEQSMEIVTHWQKKHLYKDHMDEAAFAAYTKNLVQQGAMVGNEKYVTENRPTDLYLHFLPFLQGMLYVGNEAPLKEDELQLVQNLADAFSTAYARYEDFNKLELAKAEVESAMTELKATQSQLIQQEKLASLGQLTAGIAHEIKNPLNFVNNFSEVSIEMIEEIKEERAKVLSRESGSQETRDETLVDEILEDIQSNLGKIHEHGTRANTIVTSMLQHSRGGSGKKEPTDLNALIKEYVNLSFHGMRAGKNPINVDIVLDLDPEIKEVSLINEDFTRVIINLCNNAFDALKTVKTQRAASLSVRTKKHLDTITIEIEDNGPGIPDEIKDKILQPFFTTKKGTEGTGLGLSITHDIVKAHGGELTLASKEEVGTQFTIKIPIA